MNVMIWALGALLLSVPLTAETLHAVVVPQNQRAFAASSPVTDAELEDAAAVYAWTDQLPVRRFTRDEFLRVRARLQEDLAKGTRGVQRVQVTSATRKDLGDVSIRFAPAEMWTQVPENLLPVALVAKEGTATLPYREGLLRLRAMRKNEGTLWRDTSPSKRAIELQLLPALDVVVAVLADRPVTNATATLLQKREGAVRPELIAQYAADEKSTITVASLPSLDPVTLLFFAPGYAPASLTGIAEDFRSVELQRAGALRGRLLDGRGKPIAGARIRTEAWVSNELPALSRGDTTSNAEGKWEIRDLPLRETSLAVQANGFATYRDTVTPAVPDAELGDLVLEPALQLTVEVVDEIEEPVADATVRVDGLRAGTTNAKGIIALDALASTQPADLTILRDGFQVARVSLTPPFATLERVTLRRSFYLRGRLVDETLAPIRDARALVEVANTYRTDPVGADGTFDISITDGKEARLTFESPTTASHTVTEPAGRSGEVRDLGVIRLDRGNIIRGRVITRDQTPIAGARVWALRQTPSGTVGAWLAERAVESRTDEDGAYELRGVSSGATLLRIDARGYARAHRNVVVEDAMTDAGSIELTRGSDVVVTSDGDVSNAIARIDMTGSWLEVDMIAEPLQRGRATLHSVPPGEHVITVQQGMAITCEKRLTIPDDGSRIEVTCGAPTHVTGQVLLGNTAAGGGSLSWNRTGRVMTEGVISTTRTDLGTQRQQVYGGGAGSTLSAIDSSGRFVLDALPGMWSVTWWSRDGASMPPRTIEIPEAPAAEITLRYDGAMVTGVVVDENGAPVAAARVEADANQFTLSQEDGSFGLAGLPAGRHALQARKNNVASQREQVVVQDAAPLSGVRLILDPARSEGMKVRVLTAGGQPAANAFVFVDSELGVRILTTDAAGEAEALFSSGKPASARLAALHQGSWAFATADLREPVQRLAIASTGSIGVVVRQQDAALRVLTPTGMDLIWMLSRLGISLTPSADAPLVITGLPPSTYTLFAGNDTRSVTVNEGQTTTVRFE